MGLFVQKFSLAWAGPRLLCMALLAYPLGGSLASAAPVKRAPQEQTTVVAVEDGHVLRVRLGRWERRVRLACVDTPEKSQEPWATAAQQALAKQLPLGTAITVEMRARDVYDRIVAVVRRDGQDVSPPLLQKGFLFVHDGYLGRCDDLPYAAAEARARQKQLGVWAEPGGIQRPWDLRQEQQQKNPQGPLNGEP